MSPEGVEVRHVDKVWIGGRWQPPSSGRMIELVSPDTEAVVGAVAEAGPRDMDAAVAAARDAFEAGGWSQMQPRDRLGTLERMASHLHARTQEIARAWTLQMGGLASFGPAMTAGSTHAFEQIIAAAQKF